MSLNIEAIHNENVKAEAPSFRAGDTVTVNVKVIVIQQKNSGISKTLTVRKMSGSVAVERIFPVNSPRIDSIVLDRAGKVRQSRIYYMRNLRGKAARIDEREA